MHAVPRQLSRRRLLNGTVRFALVVPLMHRDLFAEAARIDAETRRTLRAAADAIIPADGRMPAASGVGAVSYIERLAGKDRLMADLLVSGLRVVGEHAEATYGRRYDLLAAERQTAVLAHIEKTNTPADFFTMLRDLVYEAYYTDARVQQLVGYHFRSGRHRTAPLELFDERLLARVRRQETFYRDVP
jgi:gluconate 2-dehydrogenase subunit 3-like protein